MAASQSRKAPEAVSQTIENSALAAQLGRVDADFTFRTPLPAEELEQISRAVGAKFVLNVVVKDGGSVNILVGSQNVQGDTNKQIITGQVGAAAVGKQAVAVSHGNVTGERFSADDRRELRALFKELSKLVNDSPAMADPSRRAEAEAAASSAIEALKGKDASKKNVRRFWKRAKKWVSGMLDVGMFAAGQAERAKDLLAKIPSILSAGS